MRVIGAGVSQSNVDDVARVDIVMPVHNGGTTLESALLSLLGQTHRDFRLLVVNDRSTDGSVELIERFAAKDPRIHLAEAERPGIVGALNTGLALARAPYVARMDHDDIALPERLARQVAFLDAHPEHVLVGTRVIIFGQYVDYPNVSISDAECRRALRFYNPFYHPSVMFRRNPGGMPILYDADFQYAEDYDFFRRYAAAGKIANLDEVLLLYRAHAAQTSRVKARALRSAAFRVALAAQGKGRVPAAFALVTAPFRLPLRWRRRALNAAKNHSMALLRL